MGSQPGFSAEKKKPNNLYPIIFFIYGIYMWILLAWLTNKYNFTYF